MRSQVVGLWLPIIIFIVTCYLNVYHYSESLYIMGEIIIVKAQQYESPAVNAFFIFFTFLIEPYLVVTLIILGLTLFKRKFEGIVMAVGIMFNIFTFLVMKAFYLEPRPFWTSKQIKNIGYYCPKDYGSPSGHT